MFSTYVETVDLADPGNYRGLRATPYQIGFEHAKELGIYAGGIYAGGSFQPGTEARRDYDAGHAAGLASAKVLI